MKVLILAPGDERLLLAATAELDEVALSPDEARRLLAEPTFVMVVALGNGGGVMGRIYGHILYRPKQTDFFIYEVDVVESNRREGVARAMLERLKAFCEERGFGEMFVLTEQSNREAMPLYKNTGAKCEALDVAMFVYPGKP